MEILTTLLIIIGSITVAILLIVLLAVLWWILRVRRLTQSVAGMPLEALKAMNLMQAQPVRLHLRPVAIQWGASARVEAAIIALENLGYTRIGTYSSVEAPQIRLLALVNEPERLYAVIYEMDPAGVWVDVVARHLDGGSLTCTNTQHVGTLDQRPGHAKQADPLLEAAELHGLAITGVTLDQRHVASAKAFVTDFERAYADEMDWRASRGGPSESEIRRVGARYQINADEKSMKTTMESIRGQSRLQLDESLRARFMESGRLSAAEWERVRNRMVILHDQMSAVDFHDAIAEYVDEVPQDLADAAMRAQFQALNQALPVERRFLLLASIEGILPADAWEPPLPASIPTA